MFKNKREHAGAVTCLQIFYMVCKWRTADAVSWWQHFVQRFDDWYLKRWKGNRKKMLKG